MMQLSFAGLLGAIAGTVVAAINYGMVIGFVQRSLRAHDRSQTPEERATFEGKLAVMRRTVLAFDILFFGGIGYWLGDLIGG
jgi:hypothetical protein